MIHVRFALGVALSVLVTIGAGFGQAVPGSLESRFLAAVDEEITKIAPQYPHLAAWAQSKPASADFTVTGKSITTNSLIYTHRMKRINSAEYRDFFGASGCCIVITLSPDKDMMKVTSLPVKTKLLTEKVGELRIVATVATERPANAKLEQTINDLIRDVAAKMGK